MLYLKKIKLQNYCGYKDFELDFTDNDNIKTWTILYGPNGTFKSTFLRAIDLLANPKRFIHKNNILTFRKLKHHNDYNVGSENLYSEVTDLKMEATFVINGIEKRVILEDNIKGITYKNRVVDEQQGEISGIKLNELSNDEQGILFIDADNRNMMDKFQIISELQEPFCNFAKSIYGFDCYCPKESKVIDRGIEFLTDFVIVKSTRNDKNTTQVHYRRFSDGEKKIATLVASLFKRGYKNSPDRENKHVVCIDNIEQHVYFKRHLTLLQKMEEYFPNHQFIATTHSSVIVENIDKKYLVDME